MSPEAKEVVDRAMARTKLRCLPRGFAPPPLVCSLARRLMRDCRPVVETVSVAVAHAWQALSAGSPITPQAIDHKQTGSVGQSG